jgi:hypothetical protein
MPYPYVPLAPLSQQRSSQTGLLASHEGDFAIGRLADEGT